MVTRPGGCALLQGPFALSINGALLKIPNTWGSRLTWTAQREHAAQIVSSMGVFYANAIAPVLGQGAGWDGGAGPSASWEGG